MNSGSFVSSNRSVGLNQFHFEWCPKYRKPVLRNPDVSLFLETDLLATCAAQKVLVHSLHVGADHVHMFVSLPFDLSVSKAFNLLKGRSSRALFQKFPWLKNLFRKGHLWSPGKFSRTVSNVRADTVKHYIENHKFKELNETIQTAREEAQQMRLSTFFHDAGSPAL
jgi:putative transposase